MTEITTEKFTLPGGQYIVGCPMMIMSPNGQARNESIESEGLGDLNGHKHITFRTGMDGSFKVYDMEDSEQNGKPEHIDTLSTDIARMSIIAAELVPDWEAALEHGMEFYCFDCDEQGNEVPGSVEVTVHRDTSRNNRINEIDIEWYKLVIWNDKLFGGEYGEES